MFVTSHCSVVGSYGTLRSGCTLTLSIHKLWLRMTSISLIQGNRFGSSTFWIIHTLEYVKLFEGNIIYCSLKLLAYFLTSFIVVHVRYQNILLSIFSISEYHLNIYNKLIIIFICYFFVAVPMFFMWDLYIISSS